MNLPDYFARLREHRAALEKQFPDGTLYLTSVQNAEKGTSEGSVAIVSTDVAARCLAESTHRIATDDEISAFKALQADNRTAAQDVGLREDTPILFLVPPRKR
jgi:guanylate kinase